MVPKSDIMFLRKQIYELHNENLNLRSDNAYLKGKVEAYEYFLKSNGYIKGDEE